MYVFIKYQQLTRRNARRQRALMTRSVYLHRHDVLTFLLIVLLHCPITIIFNVFINDFEINLEGRPALFKYADDCTIIVPFWGNGQCRTDLVDQFLSWSSRNRMTCNPTKCKEIIFHKKGFSQDIAPVSNILQCAELSILGDNQSCIYNMCMYKPVFKKVTI